MSGDPKRWLDDEGAPDGARELLAQARRTPAADKRALALSAAALLELGTQPATAAAAVLAKLSAAPAALAGLPLAGKLAVATATIALATVAVVQVAPRAQRPHAHAAPTAVPAAPIVTARASTPAAAGPVQGLQPVLAPSAPAPEASPVAASGFTPSRGTRAQPRPRAPERSEIREPAPAASTSGSEPAPEPADELALEVRWLDQARALLARDPGAALARADAHAQRFASGALAAERELIAIDALQRLGRVADARKRADALLADHAGSLYRGRLSKILDRAER